MIPDSMPSESSKDVQIVEDESRRRMSQVPSAQLAKMYGKGFKLLQKAGFDPAKDAERDPPIKVLIRRRREGLKDDDLAGREALGEKEPESNKVTSNKAGKAPPDFSEFVALLPKIRTYVAKMGGSMHYNLVYERVIKKAVKPPAFKLALVAIQSYGESHGLKVAGNNESTCHILITNKSPSSESSSFKCVCAAPDARTPLSFPTQAEWAAHAYSWFEFSHEDYENRLMKISQESGGMFYCLACMRPFPDLVRIVKHCKAMGNDFHASFGKILIALLLVDRRALSVPAKMLLKPMKEGDDKFPWLRFFSDLAPDKEEETFDTPTPIALSDDEGDVVEVVKLEEESDESDSPSLHDMHGVINLED